VDYQIGGAEETIAVGSGSITAYHCPGHSPGSLVYLAEIDGQRILFGQDIMAPCIRIFCPTVPIICDP